MDNEWREAERDRESRLPMNAPGEERLKQIEGYLTGDGYLGNPWTLVGELVERLREVEGERDRYKAQLHDPRVGGAGRD